MPNGTRRSASSALKASLAKTNPANRRKVEIQKMEQLAHCQEIITREAIRQTPISALETKEDAAEVEFSGHGVEDGETSETDDNTFALLQAKSAIRPAIARLPEPSAQSKRDAISASDLDGIRLEISSMLVEAVKNDC